MPVFDLSQALSLSISVHFTISILKTVLEADLGEASKVGQRLKFNPQESFIRLVPGVSAAVSEEVRHRCQTRPGVNVIKLFSFIAYGQV
jgi:hypothetical protein